MKTVFCVLPILFVTSLLSTLAAKDNLKPTMALSPPRMEIFPEKEKGHSITVLNLGDKPMKVEVAVQNWDLDEDNKFRPLAPTEQSLDQWLIINPVRLEVPANSQQTVRLAVRPRGKPVAGEHRAMVFFKQLLDPNKKGQISFNVGVPIYAYFGEVERSAEVHDIRYDKETKELIFDVTNQGNAYVRPEGVYAVVAANSYKQDKNLLEHLDLEQKKVTLDNAIASGKLSSQPVLAAERRSLNNKILKDETIKEPYMVAFKVDIAGQRFEKVFKVNESP